MLRLSRLLHLSQLFLFPLFWSKCRRGLAFTRCHQRAPRGHARPREARGHRTRKATPRKTRTGTRTEIGHGQTTTGTGHRMTMEGGEGAEVPNTMTVQLFPQYARANTNCSQQVVESADGHLRRTTGTDTTPGRDIMMITVSIHDFHLARS